MYSASVLYIPRTRRQTAAVSVKTKTAWYEHLDTKWILIIKCYNTSHIVVKNLFFNVNNISFSYVAGQQLLDVCTNSDCEAQRIGEGRRLPVAKRQGGV